MCRPHPTPDAHFSPNTRPSATDRYHVTLKEEKLTIKAVVMATAQLDSTNQWASWGWEMLRGVPASYIKSVGQWDWAAHTERKRLEWKKAEKDDINTGREMLNSGGSIPVVVYVANLCVALCVGGKIPDFNSHVFLYVMRFFRSCFCYFPFIFQKPSFIWLGQKLGLYFIIL